MTRNFTRLNLNVNVTKSKAGIYPVFNVSERTNPSEIVIRNILNYSKALSAMTNNLTGNISLILLN